MMRHQSQVMGGVGVVSACAAVVSGRWWSHRGPLALGHEGCIRAGHSVFKQQAVNNRSTPGVT